MEKEESVDLPKAFMRRVAGGVDPEQICRTCPKNNQRPIFKCAPDRGLRLEPLQLGTGRAVPVALGKKPASSKPAPTVVSVDNREAFAVGIVEGCGWRQLDKCRSCGNFVPLQVAVSNDDPPPRYRYITIGGHCRIPPEGIQVGSAMLTCVRKPIAIEVSDDTKQSCSTCRYCVSNDSIMLHHVTPLAFELTSYERELAEADADPEGGVGRSIQRMRRQKMQVKAPVYRGATAQSFTWAGLQRTYRMRIAPGGITYRNYRQPDGTVVEKPFSYQVILPEIGGTIELFADNGYDSPLKPNEPFGLVTQISDTAVAVEVHAPWHRLLNLPDRNDQSRWILPKTVCDRCKGTGTIIEQHDPDLSPEQLKKLLLSPSKRQLCPECDTGEFIGRNAVGISTQKTQKRKEFVGKKTELPPTLLSKDFLPTEIEPSCQICSTDWGPCYYHQKKPKKKLLKHYMLKSALEVQAEFDDENRPSTPFNPGYQVEEVFTEFTAPGAVTPSYEPPTRQLHFDRQLRRIVDGRGDNPHPSVVMLRWRSLLANAADAGERAEINRQVLSVLSTLETHTQRMVNYAWIKESPLDPWHHYCAINQYDAEHGGHPDGSADLVDSDGVEYGPATRGINFQVAWNDQFGTPRSDQSTNIVVTTWGYMYRDPHFCLPRWQERTELERVYDTGMREQENHLLNQALLDVRRESIPYEPKDMPASPVVQDLGFGVPVEAAAHFEADEQATTDGNYWVFPRQGETQPLRSKALLDFLNEEVFLEGTDATRTTGFWVSNRERLLGYSLRHNQRIREVDIASVAEEMEGPVSDEVNPEQERNEVLVCSICFNSYDDSGTFEASELTDTSFKCPSGDGGILIRKIRRPEWLEPEFRIDADQMRTYVDPSYRRTPDGELSAPPDSQSWRTKTRLEQQYCPCWQPRKWRGRRTT